MVELFRIALAAEVVRVYLDDVFQVLLLKSELLVQLPGGNFQVFQQPFYLVEPLVGGLPFGHVSGIDAHRPGHGGELF